MLLTALGAATFADPDGMLAGAVAVYGAIAVIMGIEDIIVYARIARFTGLGPMLSLISGILSVMCGIMLMANPNAGIWVLTVLLPVWFWRTAYPGLRAWLCTAYGQPVLLLVFAGAGHYRHSSQLYDAV